MSLHRKKEICGANYVQCLHPDKNPPSPPTPSPIVVNKLNRTFKWLNLTGNTIINYTISNDKKTATIHIEGFCTGPTAPVGFDFVTMTVPLPVFLRPKFDHQITWSVSAPPMTIGTMILDVDGSMRFGDGTGKPISILSGGAPDIEIFPGSYTYHL